MGVVWAARHLALETDVAVKLIRPERVAADPGLVARFEREARATARIAHPHVVQVMDYGVADGAVPYLVMELLRGFSLAELIERGGRLSLVTDRSLVEQVGSALESAHDRGVVHRDVKPHNVFITEGSRGYPLFVKVLDFGVAKMLGDAQVSGDRASLTEDGAVIGSPPYMSPEQLEGSKDVDLRSDLWSLAVIAYETLTGALPFQGASFVSVGAAVLKGRYRPASELAPNLPASIDDWFAKALSVDRASRFQSAREMVEAFLEQADPLSEREPFPDEARLSAPATTVPAAVARVEAAATADHAPLARRPADARTPKRPRFPGGARRIMAAGAVVAAGATTLGLAWPPRPPRTCPSGTVLIRGATFPMGSAADDETPSDETPIHRVAVRSFCLDVTEVTVGAYTACADCEPLPLEVELEGLTPRGRAFDSPFCNRPEARDHPVNCVDWHQARAYCKAQGRRLPTEAEWELAARGEEARPFPWGDAPPSALRLNACGGECSRMLTARREAVGKGPWPSMYGEDDGAPATSPVGRYPDGATPAGVLDLAGNVWEWTESPYCPYGKDDCGESHRVLRGGGWDTTESQYVRSAHRLSSAPSARGRSIGFRCAVSP